MTVFDLLFIAIVLAVVTMLLTALVGALRGRGERARMTLGRVGLLLAAYFSVVTLVSALSPQRFVRVGDDQCSDDWCIAVESVRRDTTGTGAAYLIDFRLSSRARRVTQRERFVRVYLRDARGHRYDPLDEADEVPFDTLLQPGESVVASRRFLVPDHASIDGLVVAREGGGRFPGCCIIDDESSLFHRRTIVRLASR